MIFGKDRHSADEQFKRLRGPCGAQFEFTLAAIAQNLRRLAKLVVRPPPVIEPCFAKGGAEFGGSGARPSLGRRRIAGRLTQKVCASRRAPVIADFCNKIGQLQTSRSIPSDW
jgi:hypothetical protein